MSFEGRPMVSLDFDGVLHTYASGWTGYDPTDGPEPGALALVDRLLSMGYRITVVSSRAHTAEGVLHIQKWMTRHGFPPLPVTHEKVIAVAYVDDRAVPYTTGSGDFSAVMENIKRLTRVAEAQDSADTRLP